eukprot:1141436-Prorocentrum_minimum.AAC.1
MSWLSALACSPAASCPLRRAPSRSPSSRLITASCDRTVSLNLPTCGAAMTKNVSSHDKTAPGSRQTPSVVRLARTPGI